MLLVVVRWQSLEVGSREANGAVGWVGGWGDTCNARVESLSHTMAWLGCQTNKQAETEWLYRGNSNNCKEITFACENGPWDGADPSGICRASHRGRSGEEE